MFWGTFESSRVARLLISLLLVVAATEGQVESGAGGGADGEPLTPEMIQAFASQTGASSVSIPGSSAGASVTPGGAVVSVDGPDGNPTVTVKTPNGTFTATSTSSNGSDPVVTITNDKGDKITASPNGDGAVDIKSGSSGDSPAAGGGKTAEVKLNVTANGVSGTVLDNSKNGGKPITYNYTTTKTPGGGATVEVTDSDGKKSTVTTTTAADGSTKGVTTTTTADGVTKGSTTTISSDKGTITTTSTDGTTKTITTPNAPGDTSTISAGQQQSTTGVSTTKSSSTPSPAPQSSGSEVSSAGHFWMVLMLLSMAILQVAY